ncbi:MAG: hypothetical protein K6F82_04125, partial [Sphaerochaetaceae bacterium]|nr:hypothetical protein [Sphaerochaetaceae bacterium]
MKKHIKLVLFTIFVVVFILSCSQEVTVDSQYYENAEAGTFVVNGRGFATLQAAIDYLNNSRAVGDNDNVIYLTKSTSGPGATISGSNITIDFQNYAFSFTNVTGLQGEDVAGKNFGLTITNGADVNLKGLEEISLYDPDTNLTMIYIEGSSTSLAIEDAPKMVVEDDQYVFWAANGATLTIGSDTATSTEATITGKIAATGTANNKPTVAVKSRSTVSGTIEATSATVNITSSANIVGGVAASASTVTVNTTRSIGTVSATNSSTVTIEGSTTVTSAIEATDSSNITVGGTSTVSGTVTSHSSSSVVFSSSASSDISINKDSGSTITVSAGTVNISGSTGTHSEVERTGGTVT